MDSLIIFHGWGSSKEKWQKVKEKIELEGIEVKVPDLPGFKPENKLKRTWTLDDYVQWTKEFSEKENRFFLLGHSFGGRIGIKFAQKYPEKIKGLILVSAAGIKKPASFYHKILKKGAETMKKLKIEEIPFLKGIWEFLRKFFYRYILRKTDYYETSDFLRETIKKVLEEDLTPLLDKIKAPTFIIWGRKDKITLLEDAFLMKKRIKKSELVVLDNLGHAPHIKDPEKLAQKVIQFILKR